MFDYKKITAGVLAAAGLIGIGAQTALLTISSRTLGDLFLLPCGIVLYRFYLKFFICKRTKGFYWMTGGLSFLFAAILVYGSVLDYQFELTWKKICAGIGLAAAVYPILAKITIWLDHKQVNRQKEQSSKKICFICFLLTAAVWGMAYLAVFPGVLATDADYWYYEFSVKDAPVTSKWSPFYCYIFYRLIAFGKNVFGGYQAGFAVFSFVQMLFVLLAVWNVMLFMHRNFSKRAVILSAVFFSCIPTHVILALSSAQDAAFAACFTMCIIEMLEIADHSQDQKHRSFIKLMIWMVLLCIIRNNGLYAVLVMGIFAILFIKKDKKRWLASVCITAIVIVIYQGPVYRMLGIEKDEGLRMMLSLPLQQMGYAYNYGYEKLTEEQIGRMQLYMSDENWRIYGMCIADNLANCLDVEKVKSDMSGFLKLYLDVFARAPDCYIKGAALQTFGLWYPNKNYPDPRIWHPYIEYLCLDTSTFGRTDFAVSRTSLFPAYDRILGMLYGQTDHYPQDYPMGYGGYLSMCFSDVPIIGILSKAGIYFWMFLYLFCYAIYKNWGGDLFAVIGFGAGIFITVLLSPVIMYRYCAPMIFAAPLYAAAFFMPWKTKKERER